MLGEDELVDTGGSSSASCWVSLIKATKAFLNDGLSTDQSMGQDDIGSSELDLKPARSARSIIGSANSTGR